MHRAAVAARAALQLAVQLGHHRVDVRALGDRVPVRAVRRGDHVVRLERRHHARGDRLLADARRAGSRAARRRGSAPRPSPRSGGSAASRGKARGDARPTARPFPRWRPRPCPRPSPSALIMLTAAWESSSSGVRSGRSFPRTGREARLNLSVAKDEQRARAAALLGPAGPGRLGDDLRVSVTAPAAASAPTRRTKLFGKLDDERIRAHARAGRRSASGSRARRRRASQLADAVGRGASRACRRTGATCYCELQLTSSDHLARAALLTGADQSDPRAGPQRLPLPRRAHDSATAPRRR